MKIFEILRPPFIYLSEVTQLPYDQSKIAGCLITNYLLSIILSKISNPTIKHIYSFSLGILMQSIVYEDDIFQTIGCALSVYLTILVTKRNCVTASWIVAFAYLTLYQIYRYYADWGSWKMDASFSLMILVSKLTSFAWSYRDAAYVDSLSTEQKERMIDKLPGLFEYYSYVFFLPGCLVGPVFEFRDFQDYMNNEGRYKNAPKAYGLGALMLLFGALSGLGFNLFYPDYNHNIVVSKEFEAYNMGYKLLYIGLTGYVLRFKFYTGFYLAQASVDASGLSFSGIVNGKPEFEQVLTCARLCEVCLTAKEGLDNWNKSVQVWLRRCVYERMLQADLAKGRKQNIDKATYATFGLSAFWHGINPSYYFTFFIGWVQLQYGRNLFKAQQKLKLPYWLYASLSYPILIIGMGFLMCNHYLFYVSRGIELYRVTYLIPIWFPTLLGIALRTFANSVTDSVNNLKKE